MVYDTEIHTSGIKKSPTKIFVDRRSLAWVGRQR